MGKKGIFQDKDWYVPFCNDLIFMAEKKNGKPKMKRFNTVFQKQKVKQKQK